MLEAVQTDRCLTVGDRVSGTLVILEDSAVCTDRVDVSMFRKKPHVRSALSELFLQVPAISIRREGKHAKEKGS